MRRSEIDRAFELGTPVAYQNRKGGGYSSYRFRTVDGIEYGEDEMRRIRGYRLLKVEIIEPGAALRWTGYGVERVLARRIDSRSTIVRTGEGGEGSRTSGEEFRRTLDAGTDISARNADLIGLWDDWSWVQVEQDRLAEEGRLRKLREARQREYVKDVIEGLVVTGRLPNDGLAGMVGMGISVRGVRGGAFSSFEDIDAAYRIVAVLAESESRSLRYASSAIAKLDAEIAEIEGRAPVQIENP